MQSGRRRPEHGSDTFARTMNQQAKNGNEIQFQTRSISDESRQLHVAHSQGGGGGGGRGGGCWSPIFFYQSATERLDVCFHPAVLHKQAVCADQLLP